MVGALAFVAAAGQGDDRPAVLADGLERRDLHRRRGPRPGPDPAEGPGVGCGTVVGLYLLANVAYLVTLPLDQIQQADQDRVGTAPDEGGPRAGRASRSMAVAIMISTFGCINGLVLSGARVLYAMARDGLFFRKVGDDQRPPRPGRRPGRCKGPGPILLALPVTVEVDADDRADPVRQHLQPAPGIPRPRST